MGTDLFSVSCPHFQSPTISIVAVSEKRGPVSRPSLRSTEPLRRAGHGSGVHAITTGIGCPVPAGQAIALVVIRTATAVRGWASCSAASDVATIHRRDGAVATNSARTRRPTYRVTTSSTRHGHLRIKRRCSQHAQHQYHSENSHHLPPFRGFAAPARLFSLIRPQTDAPAMGSSPSHRFSSPHDPPLTRNHLENE